MSGGILVALILDNDDCFWIKDLSEILPDLGRNRLELGEDLWAIRETSIDVRLGPWPYAVKAEHPMYPQIYSVFDLNDWQERRRILKLCSDYFNPEITSRT